MHKIRKSLFAKLMLLIVVSSGLVLAAAVLVADYTLRSKVLASQEQFYFALAGKSACKIDMKFTDAKSVVDQAVDTFKSKPLTRASSIALIESILTSNPMIEGSAVALAPNQDFKKAGFQMLYAWDEAGRTKVADRISPAEDYKSEWFNKPYRLKRSIWTEPYLDTDVNRMMVTYSVPVISDGRVTAIITCDLVLDSIHKFLLNLELGRRGAPLLVTSHGKIVDHPQRNWAPGTTVDEIVANLSDPEDKATIRKVATLVANNESGVVRAKRINSHKMAWFYFDNIPHVNWRVGFIIPESEILKPISDLNRAMLLVALVGLLALTIMAFLVARATARPLNTLCRVSEKLAQGDFDVDLPAGGMDEIGTLVNHFNRMRVELKNYVATLAKTTAEKERIAGELSIAREIQHGILPKIFPPFPRCSGLDIFAILDSAREVGGDLYDFALLGDDRLYICIGDVSGKGVPASLFMAIGKTLLRSTIISTMDPAATLKHVNSELEENNDACMFITVFCAIFDLKTNRLTYANAGHNPPLIVEGESSRFMNCASAPPIGAMPGISFSSQTIDLNPNTKLLLYTDGVTEAMNPAGELFGTELLMNMARSSHSRTSEKFVRDIRDAVSNFAGEAEQYDDITMLCFSNTTNHGESASAGLQQASIVVVNHQDEYKRLTTWLEEVGTNFGWNPGFLMKINLMLEEWFVNVISYAFSDNGVHEIEVKLSQNGSVVELCMIDDGQPFDPTQQPEADTESSVEERQVGGLGLHFLRGMLDEFSYRREGELNIVTMRKRMEDET